MSVLVDGELSASVLADRDQSLSLLADAVLSASPPGDAVLGAGFGGFELKRILGANASADATAAHAASWKQTKQCCSGQVKDGSTLSKCQRTNLKNG